MEIPPKEIPATDSVSELLTNSLPENNRSVEKEEEDLERARPPQSHSLSENDSSVASSVGLYPRNHRYHNVMESNDETEEFGDSDLDNIDEMDDQDDSDYYDEDDGIVCGESPLIRIGQPEREMEASGPKTISRDRSDYVNSVLNPVENTTQWKAFEAKIGSFEIAVDSSLSRWLVSPDITPAKKNRYSDLETTTPEKNIPIGSTSPRSYDDRPILGALIVEELKQMSASSSPRKSPGRNPDEMPIIGTVGTYWNNSGSAKHSDSFSSYKGIPNTTSKYREDKRVNWHSTPFEARLERALNQGAAEAQYTQFHPTEER
ncbi:Hypothetical predicted protein [Olea europaea subsp. europaea]|uniref:Uncharacterized protein n=1 Tax=Olea europaea subsp. europaea TaxID=158383 RepID=A0A8S0TAX5_OLEEU|nr:Hypothetical predicted protein [Olea europaea subsp. europaea]